MHNNNDMQRRSFVGLLSGTVSGAAVAAAGAARGREGRFLFKARGGSGSFGGGDRLAMMSADGSGFHAFDFRRPNETGFGVYDFFKDGRRAVLMSIEMDEDWKTKPFSVFYPKSRTHIWSCDLDTERLTELVQKERLAPFYAPCELIAGEERMLVSVNFGTDQQLFSMDLDGTHARPVSKRGEFVYGVSASPDGTRVAFHANYHINVARMDGTGRTHVAGRDGDIYFGCSWSPDGAWVLFQVCHPKTDPGHDRSAIWIARPDGSEAKPLTEDGVAWFATSFGTPDNPGNGSNMPRWAPDGSGILYSKLTADARSPWEFQAGRLDTNHFNRDFKPEGARGGAQICLLDPRDGRSTPLGRAGAGQWEFRAEWSADSKKILFCRAGVGQNPAIWVMDRDGGNQRRLSDGVNGKGADFPRWTPPRR
jgi:Tol biopolymer transport system component